MISFEFRRRRNRNKIRNENRNFLLTQHSLCCNPKPELQIYPAYRDVDVWQTKIPVAALKNQVQQKKIRRQKIFSSRDFQTDTERDIFHTTLLETTGVSRWRESSRNLAI